MVDWSPSLTSLECPQNGLGHETHKLRTTDSQSLGRGLFVEVPGREHIQNFGHEGGEIGVFGIHAYFFVLHPSAPQGAGLVVRGFGSVAGKRPPMFQGKFAAEAKPSHPQICGLTAAFARGGANSRWPMVQLHFGGHPVAVLAAGTGPSSVLDLRFLAEFFHRQAGGVNGHD